MICYVKNTIENSNVWAAAAHTEITGTALNATKKKGKSQIKTVMFVEAPGATAPALADVIPTETHR